MPKRMTWRRRWKAATAPSTWSSKGSADKQLILKTVLFHHQALLAKALLGAPKLFRKLWHNRICSNVSPSMPEWRNSFGKWARQRRGELLKGWKRKSFALYCTFFWKCGFNLNNLTPFSKSCWVDLEKEALLWQMIFGCWYVQPAEQRKCKNPRSVLNPMPRLTKIPPGKTGSRFFLFSRSNHRFPSSPWLLLLLLLVFIHATSCNKSCFLLPRSP